MGCCPSKRDNRVPETYNQPYPQPVVQYQASHPPQVAGTAPLPTSLPPGSQSAPPPYSAAPPPQQQVVYAPPQQVVYAQPPPHTVVYERAPSNHGTRNALLGAGAGFIGGAIFADAMDGGLFD